jgi:hypothetical protein
MRFFFFGKSWGARKHFLRARKTNVMGVPLYLFLCELAKKTMRARGTPLRAHDTSLRARIRWILVAAINDQNASKNLGFSNTKLKSIKKFFRKKIYIHHELAMK